jgi:hypothetical protein
MGYPSALGAATCPAVARYGVQSPPIDQPRRLVVGEGHISEWSDRRWL